MQTHTHTHTNCIYGKILSLLKCCVSNFRKKKKKKLTVCYMLCFGVFKGDAELHSLYILQIMPDS